MAFINITKLSVANKSAYVKWRHILLINSDIARIVQVKGQIIKYCFNHGRKHVNLLEGGNGNEKKVNVYASDANINDNSSRVQ